MPRPKQAAEPKPKQTRIAKGPRATKGRVSDRAAGSGEVYNYRVKHGLTQLALAELLGCGRATVQRAETTGTGFGKRELQLRWMELKARKK